MCGDARRLGFYGFGDSAHILIQICALAGAAQVYAFTRPGDEEAQDFARELGAVWAGSSEDPPPEPLDAAIIFAPVGALVPLALRALAPGGHGGVRRHPHERHPGIPLRASCGRSASCARSPTSPAATARSCWRSPRACPSKTRVTTYPLEDANEALADLRAGRFTGAAVLVP